MHPQQSPSPDARRSGIKKLSDFTDLVELARTAPLPRVHPVVAQEAQPAPPAAPVVEVPATRNGLFTIYSELKAKVSALCAEARTVERQLFGDDWSSVIETPKGKDLGDIAHAAIDKMIQLAERRYAPHGSKLEINRHDALKAIGFDQWAHAYSRRPDSDQSMPVDLEKLHAYLEATYGGEAGVTATFKQQAKVLIDFFGFDKPDSMAATSRYVGCTVRMWATKRDYGVNKGLYELDYRRRESLQNAFNALACVFAWAEQYDLSMDLRRQQLSGYDFYFKSRHRETFRGLACILYSEKWEFQFGLEAAAALKLFLGQYGS